MGGEGRRTVETVEGDGEGVELVVEDTGVNVDGLVVLLGLVEMDWNAGYLLAHALELDVELELALG